MPYTHRPKVRGLLAYLVLTALGVAMGTGFPACGGAGSEEGPVTIAVALLPGERESYARLLGEFTDSTGIEIELVAQQYQQIRDALRAEAIAGMGELDIVEFDVYFLPDVVSLVQDLDPLVPTIEELPRAVAEEVWSAGLNPITREELLFVPHRLNWQAMVYDARRLESPPRTWEDLRTLARTRPASIGIKGARYEGLICDFFPFLWQAGGDPREPESPEVLRALQFFAELRSGIHPGSVSFKENTILQAQEHQEILLHFNWPFVVPLLREKGLLPGALQTAPLPAGPRGLATVLGGGYLGIPKTSPRPRKAARLLEFLIAESTQRRLLKDLGWFPSRQTAWDALDEGTRRAAQGFIAMKDDVHARPLVADYERISALWQTTLARVLFDEVKPEQALRDLAGLMEKTRGEDQ